jgi:exopolyphosphatase/pppGpp-phosphohydrolase
VMDTMLQSVEFGEGSGFPEIVVTGGAGRRLRRQFGADTHAAHADPAARLLPFTERLLTEPAGRWPHPLKDPERTAITRAGAVILRAILLRWDITAWRISSYGLREGALRYHAEGHSLARLTAPGDADRFAFEM